MGYDYQRRKAIFYKTLGFCHLCHSKLSFNSYGIHREKGAWHVEHSIPKARGGTEHLNNLYPSCIDCNLQKGVQRTSTVRYSNGVSRAPYSKKKIRQIKNERQTSGGVIGAFIGSIAGPGGTFLGTILGSLIGGDSCPKK